MGLRKPNLFALGAAIGLFKFLIRSSAILLFGCLNATVFNPALTSKLILHFFFLSKTIVNGPGQKLSVIFSTFLLNKEIFSASSPDET